MNEFLAIHVLSCYPFCIDPIITSHFTSAVTAFTIATYSHQVKSTKLAQ